MSKSQLQAELEQHSGSAYVLSKEKQDFPASAALDPEASYQQLLLSSRWVWGFCCVTDIVSERRAPPHHLLMSLVVPEGPSTGQEPAGPIFRIMRSFGVKEFSFRALNRSDHPSSDFVFMISMLGPTW